VTADQAYLADRFFRHTIGDLQAVESEITRSLLIVARAGRISAAKAEALAANFAFNDPHRQRGFTELDRLLPTLMPRSQEEAAGRIFRTRRPVLQAAEERLNHGLSLFHMYSQAT